MGPCLTVKKKEYFQLHLFVSYCWAGEGCLYLSANITISEVMQIQAAYLCEGKIPHIGFCPCVLCSAALFEYS